MQKFYGLCIPCILFLYSFDSGAIDARENYWGFPSTTGVAMGKIRDQADHTNLIRVDHDPVLESNTSLIEGTEILVNLIVVLYAFIQFINF